MTYTSEATFETVIEIESTAEARLQSYAKIGHLRG